MTQITTELHDTADLAAVLAALPAAYTLAIHAPGPVAGEGGGAWRHVAVVDHARRRLTLALEPIAPETIPHAFTVSLVHAGPDRVKLMAALRKLLGIDLRATRRLLDTLPATLRTELSHDEAAHVLAALQPLGAGLTVEPTGGGAGRRFTAPPPDQQTDAPL